MHKRDIIVIGASAGGFDAIKKLVSGLPKNLEAAVFIVWHMSPDVRGILPQVLNRMQLMYAQHATDMRMIEPGNIYVAPPDHHLLLEKNRMRVSHGPKENLFRPAVDPLFRSAAYAYGPRVIGIILSGALDDGTAGLWAIKQNGGIAIVQDPEDAEVPSMPENALKAMDVDYVLEISHIPELLMKLVQEGLKETDLPLSFNNHTLNEIKIAMEEEGLKNEAFRSADLTPYTCPECHGVLSALHEGGRIRFRCHTGHAFSSNSLLAAITENIEENFWSAIRNVQESIMLLNHMGDHFAEVNQPKIAAMYFKKAREAEQRANIIRQAVSSHEHLNADSIKQEVDNYKFGNGQ